MSEIFADQLDMVRIRRGGDCDSDAAREKERKTTTRQPGCRP